MYTAKFETFYLKKKKFSFFFKKSRVLIYQISMMKNSESKFKIAKREKIKYYFKNKTTNE